MFVVARVISRQEKAFADHIQHAYVPMIDALTRTRRKRNMIVVQRPAFPGYVFVHLEGSAFTKARCHSSFLGFIMSGPDIARLNDTVVDELKARERSQEFNQTLQVGDEVIICSLNDLPATVDRVNLDTGRAVVNAQGRRIDVEINSLRAS